MIWGIYIFLFVYCNLGVLFQIVYVLKNHLLQKSKGSEAATYWTNIKHICIVSNKVRNVYLFRKYLIRKLSHLHVEKTLSNTYHTTCMFYTFASFTGYSVYIVRIFLFEE